VLALDHDNAGRTWPSVIGPGRSWESAGTNQHCAQGQGGGEPGDRDLDHGCYLLEESITATLGPGSDPAHRPNYLEKPVASSDS
jgi:hypothetical protein